ncbi:MAG: hypothetical protein KOO60_14095 [Gemmatimonadales bacterium]|nr:hypothetical protein [Gemmatimonadales bacterium]
MKSRVMNLTLVVGLVIGLVGMTGCSGKDGNEWERLVCEVETVNDGYPLLSAYQEDSGGEITFPVDWVQVEFRARSYSTSLTIPEDGPYSWFHITNYNITWTPSVGFPSGSVDDLVKYNLQGGLCDVIVPVDGQGIVSIMITDRNIKDEAWFGTLLADPDAVPSYSANCQLEFIGHESGSDRQVVIPCGLMVTFVGQLNSD